MGTIYIRVREPVGTMGSAECAPKPWCLAAPPRLLRETQPPAPEHVVLCGNVRACVVLCGNVRLVPAEQSGALAPFRGCGPKKQSISLLPTARRSFSFIDSCPPIRTGEAQTILRVYKCYNSGIINSISYVAAKSDQLKKKLCKGANMSN